jgi:hypothetical protein
LGYEALDLEWKKRNNLILKIDFDDVSAMKIKEGKIARNKKHAQHPQ